MKTFNICITRRTMTSCIVNVDAKDYTDAVEKVLKKTRMGEIKWPTENVIFQHDCEDTNPETFPNL